MPRSQSPPRGPRQDRPRDHSPRRDRERDRDRDRSRSPLRSAPPRKPKELSFYKKGSSSSVGSFSHRRDPLDAPEESAKDRMERRDRGEVPARFGGTREQGVRNTMSAVAPQGSVGSLKRVVDPLDRMAAKRGEDYREERGAGNGDRSERRPPPRDGDSARDERVAAMEKTERRPAVEATAAPSRPSRLIEVIANDRLGRKVRIKCLPTDTVGDLKRLIAAQTGTTHQKIQLKKWYTVFKDNISLQDYEINDGMSLEMY